LLQSAALRYAGVERKKGQFVRRLEPLAALQVRRSVVCGRVDLLIGADELTTALAELHRKIAEPQWRK
jgi:hypothetical protein